MPAYAGDPKELKILIVDDNPNFRAITKLMLTQSGYERVDDTDNPKAALNRIARGLVDVVLLDWWMPELKGIDVLKTVRTYNKQLPIVMLTSEKDQARVLEALQAGATDYIVKPYSRKTLLAKLEEVLSAMEVRAWKNAQEEAEAKASE